MSGDLSFVVVMHIRASIILWMLVLSSSSPAQNLARVEKINFPYPNFDLCLGLAITPTATFRNLDSIPHHLRVQLHIRNEITGIEIYGDTAILLDVPPNQSATRIFRMFETTPNKLSQLGRHRLITLVEVIDRNGNILDKDDRADNSSSVNIFGIRRTSQPFVDASNNYSVLKPEMGGVAVLDQHRFISIGGTVVDGDKITFDPPGPVDTGRATQDGFGVLQYAAPVIRLDRKNVDGMMHQGDTIISYPINLKGVKSRTTIVFDYHRSTKRQYGWHYDRDTLHGPESTTLDSGGAVVRTGDSLIVELRHPADSSCIDPTSRWINAGGIDGGKDLEWKRFVVHLDSFHINNNSLYTANFRFRIRLKAKSDQVGTAYDDDDAWFIDNVRCQTSRRPEVAINWVRVVTPYTRVPRSQAILPVYAKISTPTIPWSANLPINVTISDKSGTVVYFDELPTLLPYQRLYGDSVIRFKDWDARHVLTDAGNEFTVSANVGVEGYDSFEDDDEAFSKVYLNVAPATQAIQEYSLDDGTNDYPYLTGHSGIGVGFTGSSGSYAVRFSISSHDTLHGARIYFGSANPSSDAIRIGVLRGDDSLHIPQTVIEGALLETVRNAERLDTFTEYRFSKPINLDPGNYWMSVSQLDTNTMELGADVSRRGVDVSRMSVPPAINYIHRSPYATQYDSALNAGDISHSVAYEIGAGSGNWHLLTHLTALHSTPGFAREGDFIPMIRPLVGSALSLNVEKNSVVQLSAPYPNPFDPSSTPLSVASGDATSIRVINALGQVVFESSINKGIATWDGRDHQGELVSTGAYLLQLNTGTTYRIVVL